MPSYVIDSFKGGISDYEDKGIAGAFKYGANLDIRKKRDSLSCNQALTDIAAPAEGFTDIIDWFVPASDGNIYGFARDGRIYKFDTNLACTLVYTDTNGAIVGAWEWGLENGKKYLFWATATHLNAKEIPGLSDWSDVNASIVVGVNTYTYPKTDLTSSTNHMMKAVGGGVAGLVICNDETLAFVGYDGSYSNNILQFTPGNQAKAVLWRGMEAIIGTVAKNQLVQAALFSWDGNDTQDVFGYDNNKPLPIQDIQAMIDTELPLLIDNKGQVFNSDFISDLPIFVFPDGSQVNLGGVTNDGALALFGIFGCGTGNTGIYSYGRKKHNASIVPNLEYQFDCDEIGGLIQVGEQLLAAYQNGVTYGVKKIDTTNKAAATYQSIDLKQPAKLGFQKIATWSAIVLTTDPLPANCAIEVWYRMNKKGNFLQANMRGGVNQFTTTNAQEAVFFVGAKGKVQEIEIKIIPNGNNSPEVHQVESYFE